MKPIKIVVKNFQSIKDLDFEIKGFTTVTGKTNIGKSAIIRSITSAILNNPVIGMVRSGESHSEVRIVSDQYDIKWEKAERGLNRYTVNGTMYDKVGSSTLDVIKDFGFKSVKIGNEEVHPWFASQFFPIFLLDKTGPQITDFISEVSRLNTIQDSIILSSRRKRKHVDLANQKETESKSKSKKLDSLKESSSVAAFISEMHKQKDSIFDYESKLKSSSAFLEAIKTGIEELELLSGLQEIQISTETFDFSDYSKAVRLHDELSKSAKRVIPIRSVTGIKPVSAIPDISDLSKISNHLPILKMRKSLEAFKKAAESTTVPGFDGEVDKYRKAIEVQARISKYAEDVTDVKPLPEFDDSNILKMPKLVELWTIMKESAAKVISLQNELKSLNSDMKNVNEEIALIDICPTCERPRGSEC